MTHVHIIGGGLAGLSAAVEVVGRARVTVYEAGPACGGRARSFYDKALDTRIDNGNHLILSANKATFRYLGRIGAHRTLKGPGAPLFPWFDLSAGSDVRRRDQSNFQTGRFQDTRDSRPRPHALKTRL